MHINVRNAPGIVKDTTSGAIISVDDNAYRNYIAQRQRIIENDARVNDKINNLQIEINKLKEIISLTFSGSK
jgi:hypothetical protein